MDVQNRTTAIGRLSGALKKQSVLKLSMRLYLLGIAAAALVLLISFVLREKNRAELQLQQQNDALAAATQSVDAELSGCCSTIAQFINNPDLKKYASATERDLQAEVELTYYIYLSTENNPDLVNYYLYYPDTNVILSAHSAARAAQNSPFYAAVQAYTNQETTIYSLDVDGRIGFLFPFDSHFYIAYELVRSAPALVFAELDLNTIFSVLPESLQSGRNALYIMDPAGTVIYENTSNRLQTLLSDGTQRSVLSARPALGRRLSHGEAQPCSPAGGASGGGVSPISPGGKEDTGASEGSRRADPQRQIAAGAGDSAAVPARASQ